MLTLCTEKQQKYSSGHKRQIKWTSQLPPFHFSERLTLTFETPSRSLSPFGQNDCHIYWNRNF